MPQDNADHIKALYGAFERGDVPTVLGAFDPKIEWNEAENFIYADRNPYVGPQAIVEGVFLRLGAEWNNFSAVPDEIVGSGETVVAFGRYRGTYKANGQRVDAQFVHVWRLRDGKVIRFQQYTDTAQFLNVVGKGAAAKA